jgi:hypothetical protein
MARLETGVSRSSIHGDYFGRACLMPASGWGSLPSRRRRTAAMSDRARCGRIRISAVGANQAVDHRLQPRGRLT